MSTYTGGPREPSASLSPEYPKRFLKYLGNAFYNLLFIFDPFHHGVILPKNFQHLVMELSAEKWRTPLVSGDWGAITYKES